MALHCGAIGVVMRIRRLWMMRRNKGLSGLRNIFLEEGWLEMRGRGQRGRDFVTRVGTTVTETFIPCRKYSWPRHSMDVSGLAQSHRWLDGHFLTHCASSMVIWEDVEVRTHPESWCSEGRSCARLIKYGAGVVLPVS